MNILIDEAGGAVLVRVNETRIDAAAAAEFKDRLRPHIACDGPDVMMDLSQVAFIDSSGLGAVIALRKALPAGRQMRLAGLTPNVARVFRLTRMDSVFEIFPSVAAARA
ncbi:MAG: STAS domain-containing protein [Paracoccus sp. (in: a-proteobacteria)]|nr:STAS domain-containing protein [Paracoccus sp. (in: a-proteobacteria)]